MFHYLRAIRKEISERKLEYPKIQDVVDGINSVGIKFRQKSVTV